MLQRMWTIARVLREHRVLHLVLDLLPAQSWLLRSARRVFPHIHSPDDAAHLRQALEKLGPIFIKFGQVLSTRPDLLPADYIAQLSQLQDNISPVPTAQIRQIIETQLNARIDDVFSDFDDSPVATASVAQVHRARVAQGSWAGRDVAVKVLRPNIDDIIRIDIECMYFLARQFQRRHIDGERLRPVEVVAQIEQHLQQELDLQCEAANSSVLRHNFAGNSTMFVPEVCWDYCAARVMVQEWMVGVPVSRLNVLDDLNIDKKRLARDGVEVFFTQVFRDGFFHADMHPGNIFIGTQGAALGHYIALDCGIVGSLSETDRHYLAVNFLAFFNRDYHAIALAHIDSGWVPTNTPIAALTNAVRSTCEPYFGRPLSEISLGLVLTRLFDISRQFNISVQPQLVLLQKTLLNIEGMGRILDDQLDLWSTAKPFLERWMKDTLGPRGILRALKREWPLIVRMIPTAPRELLNRLHSEPQPAHQSEQLVLLQQQLKQHKQQWRWFLLFFGASWACVLWFLSRN
ncbi:MAG: 2-polyprenylphenol 6-hydroxylase [Formosimonas sp.]